MFRSFLSLLSSYIFFQKQNCFIVWNLHDKWPKRDFALDLEKQKYDFKSNRKSIYSALIWYQIHILFFFFFFFISYVEKLFSAGTICIQTVFVL